VTAAGWSDVRFGLLADFSGPEPWVGSLARWWEEVLELLAHAEQLGFDACWIGEHHFQGDGFAASPLVMATAVARATTRMRIGSYVLVLPLHNALRVAEEAAAVDVLSGGRLDFGVGMGYLPVEFASFGVDRRARRQRMLEGVDVVRGLWTTDGFSYAGEHYAFQDLSIRPRPLQQPHPPLWMSARSEGAARRAARLGASMFQMGGRSIGSAYAEAGGGGRVSVYRPWFVSRDPERDFARHREHFVYFNRRNAGWLAQSADTEYDAQVARALADASDPLAAWNSIFDTPEAALAELRAYRERKPFTDLIAPLGPPYDAAALAETLELFAAEVIAPLRAETPAASRASA
jgi:alkanesulfonate monooxygenase SsuD/methylene tetrahydromethanopterin reductase-like flavin-dependent oxidoreductase (luciferase family)